MQLPILLPHLQLSSPPPDSPLLHHSSALHCMMQLPLLCSSPPFLLSPIYPPLLSTGWCSFLSSSLICSSPLLHLTPLLLSSSDLHSVMQLPVLLPHLQLSSPPSNSSAAIYTAWCSFLSSAALLSSPWCSFLSSISPLSPPLLSTAWCSFLSSSLICNSPLLHLTPLISTAWCSFLSSLICSSPLLHLSSPPSHDLTLLLLSPLLQHSSAAWCSFLSSPPSNSSAALLLRGLRY